MVFHYTKKSIISELCILIAYGTILGSIMSVEISKIKSENLHNRSQLKTFFKSDARAGGNLSSAGDEIFKLNNGCKI